MAEALRDRVLRVYAEVDAAVAAAAPRCVASGKRMLFVWGWLVRFVNSTLKIGSLLKPKAI